MIVCVSATRLCASSVTLTNGSGRRRSRFGLSGGSAVGLASPSAHAARGPARNRSNGGNVLLDRLLYHDTVVQIEGASYRLREHADLIPEHVRANTPSRLHRHQGAAADLQKPGG